MTSIPRFIRPLFLAAAASAAHAQIMEWNFTTATPSSDPIVNLNTPTVSQYNNNGTTALLTTTSASSGYTGASGGNNAGAAARVGALNMDSSGSAAFEFTLQPTAGFKFTLTAASFGTRSTSTGPQAYTLRSSADGYTADIVGGGIANNGTWSLKSHAGLTFSSNASTTFRLFGYNGTGSAAANTANWRIDDLKLTLTVEADGPDTTPPTVVTYSPAAGAPAAPLDANLVLTFNEPVQAGTGNVYVYAGATLVETFAVAAGNISGNTATFNPAADFTPGTAYHVRIDAGAIKDTAGNGYAGIADDTTWNFTALVPTPPEISTLLPADNATGVALSTSLMITFNEPVQAGTGNVYLYAGATLVETFAVTPGSITGSSAVFYPAANLLAGTVYHIKIDAGAFRDLEGAAFAGIADDATWNFTTAGGVDTDPPAVDFFTPGHNSNDAPVGTNFSITFNEPVDFGGSGNLRLYVLGNPTPVKTISVDDVSIDNATATFPNDLTLAFETTYYVTLDAGTFEDHAGNPFAGISGDSTWRFTTMAPDTTPPSPVAENPVTPVHGATRVQLNTVLTITFDEAIQAAAGNILIKNADGGALVAQIAANGPQVAISSATATITPPIALPPNTTLYVEVPAGAFKDLVFCRRND